MRNFAFDTATSVQEAAAAASLVCEAMLAPDGGASDPETTLVKYKHIYVSVHKLL